MTRTSLLVLVAVLTCHVPSASGQHHYYLPLEQGNDAWYINGWTGSYDWHIYIRGYYEDASLRVTENIRYGGSSCELLRGDEEGGVVRVGSCGSDPPSYFGDPETLIDGPLYVSKTWGQTWGGGTEPTYYSNYSVDAEEDIDIPSGPVHSFRVVNEVYDGSTSNPLHYIYWYADGVGLVRFVWPCFACSWTMAGAIIPTEAHSWGRVKGLYR